MLQRKRNFIKTFDARGTGIKSRSAAKADCSAELNLLMITQNLSSLHSDAYRKSSNAEPSTGFLMKNEMQ